MNALIKVYTYTEYMLNLSEKITAAIKQGDSESLVSALKLCNTLQETLAALD